MPIVTPDRLTKVSGALKINVWLCRVVMTPHIIDLKIEEWEYSLLILTTSEGTVWYGICILYRMGTRWYLWIRIIKDLGCPGSDS